MARGGGAAYFIKDLLPQRIQPATLDFLLRWPAFPAAPAARQRLRNRRPIFHFLCWRLTGLGHAPFLCHAVVDQLLGAFRDSYQPSGESRRTPTVSRSSRGT